MIKFLNTALSFLRVHQYIKNSFVLTGLIFSNQWNNYILLKTTLGFTAFCLISSAVYILNDVQDIDADRLHPLKQGRPVASGAVTINTALTISFTIALCALSLSYIISFWAFIFILIYGLLNIGYSMMWKHIVVLDVFIISAGFMLRMLMGTIGVGIRPSCWFLLCGLMLTLFLGFTKRRAELSFIGCTKDNERIVTRKVLNDYNTFIIDQFIAITAACTILTYGLYTVSDDTVARHSTDALIYTVPFVAYGIFRYMLLVHRGKGHDTSHDLFHDPHMLITVCSWFLLSLGILM